MSIEISIKNFRYREQSKFINYKEGQAMVILCLKFSTHSKKKLDKCSFYGQLIII